MIPCSQMFYKQESSFLSYLTKKRGNKEIANRGIFRDFKPGLEEYKSGQKDCKSRQRFQIGAGATSWGREYKSVRGA